MRFDIRHLPDQIPDLPEQMPEFTRANAIFHQEDLI